MHDRLHTKFHPHFNLISPLPPAETAEEKEAAPTTESFLSQLVASEAFKQLHRYYHRSLVLNPLRNNARVTTHPSKPNVIAFLQSILTNNKNWYAILHHAATTIKEKFQQENPLFQFIHFETASNEIRQGLFSQLLQTVDTISQHHPTLPHSQYFHIQQLNVFITTATTDNVLKKLRAIILAMSQRDPFLLPESTLIASYIEKFPAAELQATLRHLHAILLQHGNDLTTEHPLYFQFMTIVKKIDSARANFVTKSLYSALQLAENFVLAHGLQQVKVATSNRYERMEFSTFLFHHQLYAAECQNDFAKIQAAIELQPQLSAEQHSHIVSIKSHYYTLISTNIAFLKLKLDVCITTQSVISQQHYDTIHATLNAYFDLIQTTLTDAHLSDKNSIYTTSLQVWSDASIGLEYAYTNLRDLIKQCGDNVQFTRHAEANITLPFKQKIALREQHSFVNTILTTDETLQKNILIQAYLCNFDRMAEALKIKLPPSFSAEESQLESLYLTYALLRQYAYSWLKWGNFHGEFSIIRFTHQVLATLHAFSAEQRIQLDWRLSRVVEIILLKLLQFIFQEIYQPEPNTKPYNMPPYADAVSDHYKQYYTDICIEEYYSLLIDYLKLYQQLGKSTFIDKTILAVLNRHVDPATTKYFSTHTINNVLDWAINSLDDKREDIAKKHKIILTKLHIMKFYTANSMREEKQKDNEADRHYHALLAELDKEIAALDAKKSSRQHDQQTETMRLKKRFTEKTTVKSMHFTNQTKRMPANTHASQDRYFEAGRMRYLIKNIDKAIEIYQHICQHVINPKATPEATEQDPIFIAAAIIEMADCHLAKAFDATPTVICQAKSPELIPMMRLYKKAFQYAELAKQYLITDVLSHTSHYQDTEAVKNIEQLSQHIDEKLEETQHYFQAMKQFCDESVKIQAEQIVLLDKRRDEMRKRRQALQITLPADKPRTHYFRDLRAQKIAEQRHYQDSASIITGLMTQLAPIKAEIGYIAGHAPLPLSLRAEQDETAQELYLAHAVLRGGGDVLQRLQCLAQVKTLSQQPRSMNDMLLALTSSASTLETAVVVSPQAVLIQHRL